MRGSGCHVECNKDYPGEAAPGPSEELAAACPAPAPAPDYYEIMKVPRFIIVRLYLYEISVVIMRFVSRFIIMRF